MLKILIVLFVIITFQTTHNNSNNSEQQYSKHNYIPVCGYVPDDSTAIKIAEAIWFPIYGETIYEERPFKAMLNEDDVWIVEGTLPEGFKGGVPYIEIRKRDCKILRVSHGK